MRPESVFAICDMHISLLHTHVHMYVFVVLLKIPCVRISVIEVLKENMKRKGSRKFASPRGNDIKNLLKHLNISKTQFLF